MQRILFVTGCIREEQSRSLRLARHFLESYRQSHPEAEIATVDLPRMNLSPLDPDSLRRRDQALGQWNDPVFDLARQFRDADLLVIAAPFWNGSFPACVHTYLEHICVPGLTFDCEDDRYVGLCSAKQCILVTTRGGRYDGGVNMLGDELATPILKAIMTMVGVPRVSTLAAEGLDLPSPTDSLQTAMAEAAQLAQTLA